MQSLTTHLRESEGHDRLPFHPDCPICRGTRLAGDLVDGDLVPLRAQAALAATVLALSAAGPAASAFAAEQDSQQDGSAPVAQTAPDPTDNPDFDPGGGSTDLPDTAAPVPQAQAPSAPQGQAPSDPGDDDSGPVNQSTTADPSDPVVDSGDGSDSPTTAPSPSDTSQPSTPTPSAASQPTAPTTPASTAPVPAPPDSAAPTSSAPAQVRKAPAKGTDKAARHRHRVHGRAHPRRVGTTSEGSTPTAPIAVSTTAPPPTPAPLPIIDHAKPGDHSHTVQAGESLWTIATDMLAGDATPARVAREVHRLWELNRDRIGTGDPDLLMVGTRLVLR